jgi:hypothetical protein
LTERWKKATFACSTVGKIRQAAEKPTCWRDRNRSSRINRLKISPFPSANSNSAHQQIPQTYVAPNHSPNFGQNLTAPSNQPLPTVPQANILPTGALQTEDSEEMTHVQKRQIELYRLEIWRENVRQNVVSVFQNEISIGRGSKSKPVDIALPGDPEISRRHLTLTTDGKGNFWLVNEGRNPAMINNYELPTGQRVAVSSGMTIAICSYLLRIQGK